MLLLSNEEIARLLTIEDYMAALEPMYRDYLDDRAQLSPRLDNIMPTSHEGGYYAFKQMCGGWPAQGIQALRINSDIITHPVFAGKPRRVKQPLADGRWVGLVRDAAHAGGRDERTGPQVPRARECLDPRFDRRRVAGRRAAHGCTRSA
jgi:hypothetical protein